MISDMPNHDNDVKYIIWELSRKWATRGNVQAVIDRLGRLEELVDRTSKVKGEDIKMKT
jgi:hypothetical protein